MAPVKIKLLPRSTLKAKNVTHLVGQVEAGSGIDVVETAGNWVVSIDSSVYVILNDPEVTALAGVTSAANKIFYFTGSGAGALADFPASVRTFFTTPSSANLAAVVSDETGTGPLVFQTSPALITPNIGTPSAGNLANCAGLPVTGLSLLATGMANFLIGGTSALLASAVTDETGTGALVFATSPALVTPNIGTPSAGNLANCAGLPIPGITGLGSGIDNFLATPSSANLKTAVTDETGSGALVFATSPTLVTPVLGTPSSGDLSSCTALPISTGVSGLGSNVATFLTTPSSANLAAALTDETGTGAAVFANTPTLVTPVLGVATATSINGATLDNTGWTTWTPTVTSSGGTITTVGTVVAKYKQIGKTVFFRAAVPITTIGSATGRMIITLPANDFGSLGCGFIGGFNDTNNKTISGTIHYDAAHKASCVTYDGVTFPATTGETALLSGFYEAA